MSEAIKLQIFPQRDVLFLGHYCKLDVTKFMDGNAGGKVGLLIPKPSYFSWLCWYTSRLEPRQCGTDVGLDRQKIVRRRPWARVPGGKKNKAVQNRAYKRRHVHIHIIPNARLFPSTSASRWRDQHT